MKPLNSLLQPLALVLMLMHAPGVEAQTQTTTSICTSEEKVAILPIVYISEYASNRAEEMPYFLQSLTYNFLAGNTAGLKLQDPSETNALLLKHKIQPSDYRRFSPKELAQILQVSYVLTGTVMQETVGTHSSHHTTREYGRRERRIDREQRSHGRTREEIDTQIAIDIYTQGGERIYSKSRKSVLSDADSYKNGIHYLLKRSPLYSNK